MPKYKGLTIQDSPKYNVGPQQNSSTTEAEYFPQNASKKGVLLNQVKAVFNPS